MYKKFTKSYLVIYKALNVNILLEKQIIFNKNSLMRILKKITSSIIIPISYSKESLT